MDAYTNFASVYDSFMDDIPYEEWAAYICGLLSEYEINDGLILDLGCGTGNITELMAGKSYDMIGIDISEDMLQFAMEKREQSGNDILYLQQDMRELELYGTVDGVICMCDAINYLLEYSELVQVFSLVNNYLNPDGIFIFDFNTIYKYQTLLNNSTIAEDRPESSFIWDNYFDEETMLNEYMLSIFVREKEDLYRKYEEIHYQKAYSLEEIKGALKESGLIFVTAYDAFTKNDPGDESERIYIIAREHGKNTGGKYE